MKKTVLSFIAVILLGAIYYFTLGSSQLIDEMKRQLNHELTTFSDHGFSVSDRITEKRTEHFVIKVEEPQKIVDYLAQQNVQLSLEDVQEFQDQKIGMDIEYLPSSTDAIAIDLYPVNLPRTVYEQSQPDDKAMLEIIEKMVNDKVFLAHVNVNKLVNGFDGYIQNINQTFTLDGNETTIITEDWTFEGKLNHQKLATLSQKLQHLHYQLKDVLTLELNDLQTQLNVSNEFNRTLHYTLENIRLNGKGEDAFNTIFNGIQGTTEDVTQGDLMSNRTQFGINFMDIQNSENHQRMDRFTFDTAIHNINLNALENLKIFAESDEDNDTLDTLIPLLQEMTRADTSIDIHKIAIQTITENNETYPGFALNGHAQVDKNFQWSALDSDPMKLVTLFDFKATLLLSNKIAEIMAEDPRVLMFMMFITPKEENGNKIYEIDYTKGSFAINGTSLF